MTCRPIACHDWFADSLGAQIRGDEDLEVVFVDALHAPERTEQLERVVAGRFPFRHVAPKPTPYNGPYRLTRRDFHSGSSVRNTGIVYARGSYVVFVDDLTVLAPTWLDEVVGAANAGVVVAGSYAKHREMDVRRGVLCSSRPSSLDVRWDQGRDDRPVPILGSQLYGCSFGAPRSLLVRVNGSDELCDSIGGEDYHLGMRLEWAGVPILYSRRMHTIESEELHDQGTPFVRLDKVLEPDAYLERLRSFGVPQRSTDGPCDSSHMILDILLGSRELRSIGNAYDLAELTPADLADLPRSFPERHWFDHQPLAEM